MVTHAQFEQPLSGYRSASGESVKSQSPRRQQPTCLIRITKRLLCVQKLDHGFWTKSTTAKHEHAEVESVWLCCSRERCPRQRVRNVEMEVFVCWRLDGDGAVVTLVSAHASHGRVAGKVAWAFGQRYVAHRHTRRTGLAMKYRTAFAGTGDWTTHALRSRRHQRRKAVITSFSETLAKKEVPEKRHRAECSLRQIPVHRKYATPREAGFLSPNLRKHSSLVVAF